MTDEIAVDGGKTITIEASQITEKAAKMAIECQDACNGRAVLASLLRNLDVMREAREVTGGDESNQHPVVIAVLDKLASLARSQSMCFDFGTKRIGDAHNACERLASGESVEWTIYPIR